MIRSISAIGRLPGGLADETIFPDLAEMRRVDLYGYSKLIGENAVRAEADRIRTIILNPSVILGPGSALIEKIVTYLRWIPCCPMIGNGNSFVDVRDVAEAVLAALGRGRSGERYIVTGENCDNLTFMRKLLLLMGKKAPVFLIPAAWLILFDALVGMLDIVRLNPGLKNSSGYNVDKFYSTEKIRREMGWRPDYRLEHSLRDIIAVHRGEVGREFARPYRLA